MVPLLWSSSLSASQSWFTLDHIKSLVELGAYAAALAFFAYKALAGYFITGLSLSVGCTRVRTDHLDKDFLCICATLKKSETGSLALHDAQVRITVVGSTPQTLDLVGIERLTFGPDDSKWPGTTRRAIRWTTARHPFLKLAPADEAQFSAASEVPSDLPATVEVVVLGRRLLSWKRSQWRSSLVSLPVHNESLP